MNLRGKVAVGTFLTAKRNADINAGFVHVTFLVLFGASPAFSMIALGNEGQKIIEEYLTDRYSYGNPPFQIMIACVSALV